MFSPFPCRPVVFLLFVAACDVGFIPPLGGDPALVGADTRPLAGDVAIADVAAYQAVRIPIVEDERQVPPSQRDATVVAGRDLVLRVYVTRAANAADRPLVVRLDVEKPGAAATSYTEQTVTFASGADRADVVLEVAGVDVVADLRYAVSVLDTAADEASGDTSRARWPRAADSYEALDARDSAGLAVVVVPISYNGVDAPQVPAGAMADLVQAFYPVPEGGVTVTVDATFTLTVNLDADPQSPYAAWFPDGHPFWMSDEVFAELRARRNAAGSGAYYYGYLDHGTLFGMAEAIPAPVAYGTTNDGVVTFAHELGHDLGLFHGPCGGAGGPDPAYPYAGALIGVEGYDPRSDSFLDPESYYDFMSYCSPEWVSDYHFDKLHRQLSSTYKLPTGALQAEPVPCDFVHP